MINITYTSRIHSFIHFFIHQWLYSPLLGPDLFFNFVNFCTQTVELLGRGISPSQGRYLHTGQHKHRINAHTRTNIHALSEIQTHYPSVRASEDSSRLRQRAHCDRHFTHPQQNKYDTMTQKIVRWFVTYYRTYVHSTDRSYGSTKLNHITTFLHSCNTVIGRNEK
jgi:hypothetical protein